MPSKRPKRTKQSKTKRNRKPDTGRTVNCTKKALYFQNSQLEEVQALIARFSSAGATVTFTSIVQRALTDYLAKQKSEANEADGLFS